MNEQTSNRTQSLQPFSKQLGVSNTSEGRYRFYDNSLESKIYWIESQPKFQSAINSSSVKYNIVNNCKSNHLPQIEMAKLPKFANKKESYSKFIDYQSSNSDKICQAHKVY